MDTKTEDNRDEAAVARLLRSAGRGPTASGEARARIYAAVQAEWRRTTAPARPRVVDSAPAAWSLWFMRALPVAAAVAAVAFGVRLLEQPAVTPGIDVAMLTKSAGSVALLAADGLSADASAQASIHAGDVLQTAADGGAALLLTSGAIVRIAADSELLFAASDRIELRRGTAYVDSGPEPQSAAALVLETPFGAVSHIGTQYETRVGANNLRIRIREGIVSYRTATAAGAAIDTRGTAGEQLLAIAGDDTIRRSTVALTGPDWAWAETLAAAPAGDQQALDALLEWIARETGRELSYADASVAAGVRNETIVGAAGLTPAETLDVIARSTGFAVERTDTALLVR